MENTVQIEEKKPRKPRNPKEVKDRSNVNVSLRKRDKVLLNSILNSWEKEDCNISSEVCDAIILKNMSNTNPHIQTILSTLALIESSLKSHLMTKNMSNEEISLNALSIFNEVITIDIDGNKLTNLIKGIGLNKLNLNVRNENIVKENVIEISDREIKKDNTVNVEKKDDNEILEHVKTLKNNPEKKESEIISIRNKETISTNESIKNEPDKNFVESEREDAPNQEVDALFGSYAITPGFQL